ncbi:hypothetical protein [Roseicyclus persicicus]|uniref:Uncharacterized protein n=1 Tax=Roseicyclus persicicus TaxID=2650661 RepID=A0A7X6JX30_9RHOB|nr:hypothetical protein [Roseibacterium persicicum]NKX44355.1 hypothetical protein [Roseibacterium persicicum]
MTRTRPFLLCAGIAAATGLTAQAALACMPVPLEVTAGPVAGEGCSQSQVLDEYRAVGLSSVTAAAGGLLMQDIYDGNACYLEANLLVIDCAAGQMLVIGPDQRSLETEPRETGIDRIAAWLGTEGPAPGFDEIAARAMREGYDAPLRAAAGARLSINGAGVDTTCACRG